MRISAPAKITYYDGITIEFVTEDAEGVYLHKFAVDEDSRLRDEFKKGWRKGLWWIIYCSKENHIYSISKVDPNQLK